MANRLYTWLILIEHLVISSANRTIVSYAFYIVKEELPRTVSYVIDSFQDILIGKGKISYEDQSETIEKLRTLKFNIIENKPFQEIQGIRPDVVNYNLLLIQQRALQGNISSYYSNLMHAQSYVFRKIFEICSSVTEDPFKQKKTQVLINSIDKASLIGSYFLEEIIGQLNVDDLKEKFKKLLKILLWSFKFRNPAIYIDEDMADEHINVQTMDAFILTDHSEKIWDIISCTSGHMKPIDIVIDDFGCPLFMCLCLADFIILHNLATCIRFHVKSIPWFITKTTSADFYWFIMILKNNQNEVLRQLGDRWFDYTASEVWAVQENYFWSLPTDFSLMEKYDKTLYNKLGESLMVIFMNELDYRKLFGDKNWNPSTPLDIAVSNFRPANMCVLKILTSEVICGLEQEIAENLDEIDRMWRYNGKYGVIQLISIY